MTSFCGAALAAAIFSVTFSVAAETSPPAPPPDSPRSETPAQDPPKDEKLVCKKVLNTGSRLARDQVCKTQAEWDGETKTPGPEDEREAGNQPTNR